MKTKRRFLIAGIIIGALLLCASALGFLGAVFGMQSAFQALGHSGVGNPTVLSGAIGHALIFSALGFFLFPVGLIIFIISLVLFYRLPKPPLPTKPQTPYELP